MKHLVLVSWIGHTDLRAMAASATPKQRRELEQVIGDSRQVDGDGPVKGLVSGLNFKQIHLLSSYPAHITAMFAKWLGEKARTYQTPILDPTDHAQILEAVQPIVAGITLKPNDELCFHLSPGTPAMASIWILLAKSKYPATLYQTYRDEIRKANIPFDVTVEVVPQLLSEPDRFWQHLVAEGAEETPGFSSIVGNSPPLRLAVGRAKRAAIFDVTVMILGETGSGKELFGNAIHQASHRRDGPFIPINCAAISKDLLESELFGHVKGAFTGADKDRSGAFELADGGTLFLDEVGECDLAMQAKILRALQPPPGAEPSRRVLRRVGDTKDFTVDVRVVAATNRDLRKEVQQGSFREDLFYRLSMITVKLPPLRERKGDVGLLAKALLEQINDQFESTSRPGYVRKSLPSETLKYMESYHWPGNVRELYNALVQAAIMQDTPKLKPRDIASAIASAPSASSATASDVVLGDGFDIDEHLDDIRKTLLRRAMDQANGVKARAAELLGMKHYQTLDAQLKRLKIDR
ncbi:MAG: sigma 54-interacting transcriptional regulator [bacterium]|nr:sigma 54-interacting transcriptional regulator [bacterium]